MSRIFDALAGAKGEAAEAISALIDTGAMRPPEVDPGMTPSLEHDYCIAAPERAPVHLHQPSWQPRVVSLAVAASAPVLPFEKTGMPAAEQYRIARTKITHHPEAPKMIVITSPSSGDGKSVTAINLAAALGLKAGSKVLLIDADFRRSTIHQILGLEAGPGMAEIISGERTFEETVVQAQQYPNLHILVSGSSTANPAEMLDSTRWQEFCRVARARYEYVIIDSPPLSMVADFELIQLAADGTILVMRQDHTKRIPALKALGVVPKEKLLGVILNCVENWILYKSDGYEYSRYYYNEQNGSPAEKNRLR